MIRQEFVITGCILAFLGVIACIIGVDRIQPTTAESAITFIEQVSGNKAPKELRQTKTEGYVILGIGAVLIAAGIATIIKSRPAKRDEV